MSTRKKRVTDHLKSDGENPPLIKLVAQNEEQKLVLKTIKENKITIIHGPAGCGKSFLPTIYAYQQLERGLIERIVFTRPCVEAYGEKLGFLPGDFNDKIGPYMIPLFDILVRAIGRKEVETLFHEGLISTMPLAYQRGVTFHNAFIIGDEFQNTMPGQVRLMLTRIDSGCQVVITGDPDQSDIRGKNGLVDAIERLQGIKGIASIEMTHDSIVRDPLVAEIDKRYREKPFELASIGDF